MSDADPFPAVPNVHMGRWAAIPVAYDRGGLDAVIRSLLGRPHPGDGALRCVAVVPTGERKAGSRLRGALAVYWVRVDRMGAFGD